MLLTCSYKGQEFVRVGYYVNNEYDDETLRLEPPNPPLIGRLTRNILADKPRVTRFPIKWDELDELEPPSVPADIVEGESELLCEEERGMTSDDGNDDFEDMMMGNNSSPEHQMIKESSSAGGDVEKRARNPFDIPRPSVQALNTGMQQ